MTLPANSAVALSELPRSRWEQVGTDRAGVFALLLADDRVCAQHRLLVNRFSELHLTPPQIALDRSGATLTLRAEAFVWGVCLDLDGELALADNAFDLLPGIAHTIPWPDALGDPRIVATGNGLVARH